MAVNPFPLSVALVAGILTEMSVGALARVFGTYHLEVMEAMIKYDAAYRSKHLLRKLDQAINKVLSQKRSRIRKGGVR
jgi:hypothetical protein